MYGIFKTIVVELLEPESTEPMARLKLLEPPSLAAKYDGQVLSVRRDRIRPSGTPGYATIKEEDLPQA